MDQRTLVLGRRLKLSGSEITEHVDCLVVLS